MAEELWSGKRLVTTLIFSVNNLMEQRAKPDPEEEKEKVYNNFENTQLGRLAGDFNSKREQ